MMLECRLAQRGAAWSSTTPTPTRSTRIPTRLSRAARRGARLPQRGARLLGALAPRRRARRLPGHGDASRTATASRSIATPSTRTPTTTMSFLAMDPPRHTRMRALVSRGFTPRRVAELEPRIRAIATRAPRRRRRARRCDFIARLRRQAADGRDQRAARRAARATAPSCAAGPTRRAPRRGRARTCRPAATPRRSACSQLLHAHARRPARAAARRPHRRAPRRRDRRRPALGPRDHRLPLPDDRRRQRDHDEAARQRALLALARTRSERARVRRATRPRSRAGSRRRSATTTRPRRSRASWPRDVELHGEKLRAGEKAVLLVGSANRDERVFPEPDRFDVCATRSKSLAFGQGTHFCLGAALARLEGRVALEEVLPALSRLRDRARGHRARPLGERARLRARCRSRLAGVSDRRARTAIVTGASSGIGAATAVELGALGWRVALGARREDRLERSRGRVEAAGGRAFAHLLDVAASRLDRRLLRRGRGARSARSTCS